MQPGTAMAPIKSLRNLVTTDPFYLLQNRLNRMFDFPLAPFADETLPLTNWVPACDIYETAKEIVVKAELPGLKKEDVFVTHREQCVDDSRRAQVRRRGQARELPSCRAQLRRIPAQLHAADVHRCE